MSENETAKLAGQLRHGNEDGIGAGGQQGMTIYGAMGLQTQQLDANGARALCAHGYACVRVRAGTPITRLCLKLVPAVSCASKQW